MTYRVLKSLAAGAALLTVLVPHQVQAQTSEVLTEQEHRVIDRCGSMVGSFNVDCTPVSLSDDNRCEDIYHVFAGGRRLVDRRVDSHCGD